MTFSQQWWFMVGIYVKEMSTELKLKVMESVVIIDPYDIDKLESAKNPASI